MRLRGTCLRKNLQVFSKPSRARQADVLQKPMLGRMRIKGLIGFGHGAFEHGVRACKELDPRSASFYGGTQRRLWKLKGRSRSKRKFLCHRISTPCRSISGIQTPDGWKLHTRRPSATEQGAEAKVEGEF